MSIDMMNPGVKKALRITKKITFFFLKALGIFILLLLVFIGANLTKIDRTPYKEMPYYRTTMERIKALKNTPAPVVSNQTDSIKAGWGKADFTPNHPVHLAGYGDRYGNSVGLQDSLRARAFVFDNGNRKVAMVTIDLLIVPPTILAVIHQQLSTIGFAKENVYFSATHSHNSVGHWGSRVVGRLLAGSYEQSVVDNIARAVIRAIKQADQTKEYAQLGYVKINAKDLLYNRLVREKGIVDPWLRLLKIKKQSGKVATLFTFAAHSTCFASERKPISGDYPNRVIQLLEKSPQIDFAAFFAGAMGSHAPIDVPGGNDYEQLENISTKMSALVLDKIDSVSTKANKQLFMRSLKIDLRAPQVKISEDWRLRPWLFYALYGDYPAYITALRLGDLVFVGTPCDFSGELVPQFDAVSQRKGVETIITSFNGGYVGYITYDKWYNVNEPETRHMNWFGPYNGAYFTEVIQKVIETM
ncbi:hypothetical protein M23134_06488 [Microscilla marina ATCC 23134]|uniref:Neutral ceramidase n=2 Tax=Microscilla marina TaxID=1027 RepID=A1ZYS7_MICM2|nr:hypothetical protein M23134_06488 [Microscilla marina ATCC 23134]